MFHVQILVCERVWASSNIYGTRVCVCVCIPLQVQLITLILFTSLSLSPQYFKYTLRLFLDFKAYPRRRTRPLPRRSGAHTHTHTHTHQNKGSPPHIRFPLWICKTQQWSQRWEITRTIWAIDRPPLWSNGPRLCLVSPPPPPLCFLWLCVDNQQGRRQSGLWDSDRVWLWCCTLPSKAFLSYDLQR